MVKAALESKIDAFKSIDNTVQKCKLEVSQISALMLKTKQELFDSHTSMVESHENSHQRVLKHEQKLLDIVEDTKFWIQEYKDNL